MNKKILLVLLAASFSFFFLNCNGDDPVTKIDDNNTDPLEEYLIINGKRFEGSELTKIYKKWPRDHALTLRTDSVMYPRLIIYHEHIEDTLMLGEYLISEFPFTRPPELEVRMWYAEGPPPMYCQYISELNPPTPNGKYYLKKVGDKIVSEFTAAYLTCDTGGGPDSTIIEGRVIWEEK